MMNHKWDALFWWYYITSQKVLSGESSKHEAILTITIHYTFRL
jgi:hypothetical protein